MRRLALVILFAGILVTCSKKTTPFNNTKSFTAELQIQANDQVRLSAELDAAFNDVDSVLGNADSVCSGTISIDSVDTPRVITITYNGNTCDALRSRTGSIVIQSTPGSNWATPGDSVTVVFKSLAINRLSDNKPITFTGTYIYRNSSGGTLGGLHTGGTSPVVHTITGTGVSVTYDDATLSYWRFNRQRSYTYNGGLVIATVGLDSAGNIGGVADRGANRFGNSVVTVPTSPLVLSQGCGWRTTGGQATMTNPVGITSLGFGLDSTGKPTGCPIKGGPYYFQLAWTGEEEAPYTTLLPY